MESDMKRFLPDLTRCLNSFFFDLRSRKFKCTLIKISLSRGKRHEKILPDLTRCLNSV